MRHLALTLLMFSALPHLAGAAAQDPPRLPAPEAGFVIPQEDRVAALLPLQDRVGDTALALQVFAAFRQGREVRDLTGYRWGSFASESQVRLPDVYDGLVMVFRTFDDISYGMVMSGKRVVEAYDILRHPDERM